MLQQPSSKFAKVPSGLAGSRNMVSQMENYASLIEPTDDNPKGQNTTPISTNRLQRPYPPNEMSRPSVNTTPPNAIHSPSKSSKEVLQRVFDDQELSVSSPGKHNQLGSENPMKTSDSPYADQMAAITSNLMKLNLGVPKNQFGTSAPIPPPSAAVGGQYQQQPGQFQRSGGPAQQVRGAPYEYMGQNNAPQQHSPSKLHGGLQQIPQGGELQEADEMKELFLIRSENGIQLDVEGLENLYLSFLENHKNEEWFLTNDIETKLEVLFAMLKQADIEISIGSAMHLLHVVCRTKDMLSGEQIEIILTHIYNILPVFYKSKEQIIVIAFLEIIAIIGMHNISLKNINTLITMLLDQELPMIQNSSFLAIYRLEHYGLGVLLNIANKEFDSLPLFILNKLAETPEIRTSIIVPSLVNDLALGDNKKRVSALAALNRMGILALRGGAVNLLLSLLHEGNVDRFLVTSTLRVCGEVGQEALLKLLRTTDNAQVRKAVCSILGWRVGSRPRCVLNIEIVPYQVSEHFHLHPGTMCVYKGELTPLAFAEKIGDNSETLEINSRDFLAALQRLLAIMQTRQREEETEQMTTQELIESLQLRFLFDDGSRDGDCDKYSDNPIDLDIVKALCWAAGDENATVREAAINTLGNVGLPEAVGSLDCLFKALNDPDPNTRAMAAWSVGRLGPQAASKTGKKLVEMLKDNYWKVRTTACVSLGQIGPLPAATHQGAFQMLLRILRDGSINKLTVCETIVKLGMEGEQMLLNILKSTPAGNQKLKAAIIQSLEAANVEKPTIDFVIEEVFRHASDSMLEVRKACLTTLDTLRRRSNNNITYLKPRNILPLFYFFLQDNSTEIRNLAIESICSFGPQGELMFIEGLTKDKNPVIRMECAKGLAMMGVQTFRTLLFGLRDIDENVRKVTARVLYDRFSPEMIMDAYRDKPHQKPAIVCAIKEITTLPFWLAPEMKSFLQTILAAFQGEMNPSKVLTESPNLYNSDRFAK